VKDENLRSVSTHSLVGEASLLKGVVHGGLEKDFSLLKTISVRKLRKEKENIYNTNFTMIDGPRALRAQKSLARVKKLLLQP
jgi:hypothetical protein